MCIRDRYPGLQLSHRNHPQKIFRFRARGHFLGLTPVFGHSHVRGVPTLNFGPISTKLGGTVRAIKKYDPEGQRTRSRPELRRNGRFYVRPKSRFWPKNWSYPKKSPKMTFLSLFIWAKALFFFEQLFLVVARTWIGSQSGTLFLGPKFRFLVQKSDFCHMTPILVNDPFLALGMTVNFPPWERFSTFRSSVTAVSVKKILLTAQKVFPLPTVGFYCTVKALALSARGLDKRTFLPVLERA